MKVGPYHVRIMVKAEEKEQVEALLKWASENAPAGLLPKSNEEVPTAA
jgi:hypothetical protein